MLILKNLSSFFQTYCRYKSIANTRKPWASDEVHTEENSHPVQQGNTLKRKPLNLTYMNDEFKVFRSGPLFKDPTDYLAWLEKKEEKKS